MSDSPAPPNFHTLSNAARVRLLFAVLSHLVASLDNGSHEVLIPLSELKTAPRLGLHPKLVDGEWMLALVLDPETTSGPGR